MVREMRMTAVKITMTTADIITAYTVVTQEYALLSPAFNAIFFLSITTTLTVLFVAILPLYFLLWQKAYWWYFLQYDISHISVNLVYIFPRRHVSMKYK